MACLRKRRERASSASNVCPANAKRMSAAPAQCHGRVSWGTNAPRAPGARTDNPTKSEGRSPGALPLAGTGGRAESYGLQNPSSMTGLTVAPEQLLQDGPTCATGLRGAVQGGCDGVPNWGLFPNRRQGTSPFCQLLPQKRRSRKDPPQVPPPPRQEWMSFVPPPHSHTHTIS